MPRTARHVGLLRGWLCLTVLCLASVAMGAGQETLYLKNGEKIAGVNLGFEGGTLKWQRTDGTAISVPLDEVAHIEYVADAPPLPTPAPDPGSDDAPGVDGPPGGGTDLAAPEKLAGIDDEPPRGYFGRAYQSLDATCETAFGCATDWTERIELGARFLDGNSNEDYLNVATEFEQKKRGRQTEIEAGGQYGKANHELTTNRWFGNLTIDFDRDTNWIFFIADKNEHDEFENLDYRGSFSTGFGYRFFNEDERKLIVRLGPGVTYEDFDNPDNSRTTPDAFGETQLKWPLMERLQFEHKTTVNPSVEDLSVIRINSNNGLLYKLDDDGKWKLKLGFRYEYNSEPNEGRERNDYTTSLLLVYTRK